MNSNDTRSWICWHIIYSKPEELYVIQLAVKWEFNLYFIYSLRLKHALAKGVFYTSELVPELYTHQLRRGESVRCSGWVRNHTTT